VILSRKLIERAGEKWGNAAPGSWAVGVSDWVSGWWVPLSLNSERRD